MARGMRQVVVVLTLLIGSSVVAQDTPPALTEVQRLRLQNVAQQAEIARLRLQQAGREYESAQQAMADMIAGLQVEGFTLNLQTLAYEPVSSAEGK